MIVHTKDSPNLIPFATLGVALLLCCGGCRKSSPPETTSGASRERELLRYTGADPRTATITARLDDFRSVSLKTDPSNKKVAAAKATDLLFDLFQNQDIDGRSDFADIFNKNKITEFDQIGGDLAKKIPSDRWPEFLDFIAPMNSRPTCELAISFLTKGILTEPEQGSTAYLGALTKFQTMSQSVGGGDIYAAIWSHVGQGLYQLDSKESFQSVIALSSRTHEETSPGFPPQSINDTSNLLNGLNRSIAQGINSGQDKSIKTIIGFMSENQKRNTFEEISTKLTKIDGSNYPTLSLLMDEMIVKDGVRPYCFEQLGSKFDDVLFEEKILENKSLDSSASLKSLLTGWASQRPAEAVNLVASKTRNPELTAIAFNSYLHSDSLEASQWLGSQKSSAIKDACTESLCDYLLKKGAADQAQDYLKTLPSATRDRLVAKYPSS